VFDQSGPGLTVLIKVQCGLRRCALPRAQVGATVTISVRASGPGATSLTPARPACAANPPPPSLLLPLPVSLLYTHRYSKACGSCRGGWGGGCGWV